jgi:hypothetical protein
MGGKIYTDALDNSAGVDLSDHEVNLKIFFSTLLEKKKIKEVCEEKRSRRNNSSRRHTENHNTSSLRRCLRLQRSPRLSFNDLQENQDIDSAADSLSSSSANASRENLGESSDNYTTTGYLLGKKYQANVPDITSMLDKINVECNQSNNSSSIKATRRDISHLLLNEAWCPTTAASAGISVENIDKYLIDTKLVLTAIKRKMNQELARKSSIQEMDTISNTNGLSGSSNSSMVCMGQFSRSCFIMKSTTEETLLDLLHQWYVSNLIHAYI